MQDKSVSVVSVFPTHHDAELAIKELQKNGFDMGKLSIIGKDYHTEENVVGYYNIGQRMATWGKYGAFWGWIWGLIIGSAFIFVPGVGPIVIGGPLVTWIIGALETAMATATFSALGAALYSFGIPKDSVIKYESAIVANNFVVIYHGSEEDAKKAHEILDKANSSFTDIHEDTQSLDSIEKPAETAKK